MCTAQTIGQMSTAGTATAGVLNAAGSFANAMGERRAAQANEDLAMQGAADARDRGAVTLDQIRQRTAQVKGSQRASFGAGNIALDSGSAVGVLTSTDVQGAQDVRTAQINTNKEVYGYMERAANYRAQASNANPFAATLAPLISGAGAVAGKWYDYKYKNYQPQGG